MRLLAKVFASGLGAGFSPVAPGTAGSALAAGLIWLSGSLWNTPTALVVITITYFAGAAACSVAEKSWGRDDGRMVIDEVAGMCLAACTLPAHSPWLIVAFLLFRVFDIVKPFPARQAENLPAGWGVMTDDIVAGLYALLVMIGIQIWM
jgi:phosphatidylglycerophosphatase A